ncbi:MAG TPA: glucose-6-phosphate dehydrogenase assembly protein OpcA [Pyrinomonadaceae bacterium]|nr:glucose-6-phosphate dehydrogenase assembly protein OpcA [Pyrinomonadaceae bacterium]
MQLIQIEKTLDVAVVERRLAELWTESSSDRETGDEAVVLRARVANLLVFVPSEELLDHVHELLPELTATHPSRVLMMYGARSATDNDIEMAVASYFQIDKRSDRKRLCCEEVTLKAQGNYVVELPSAALPLLVSDLATFLWWRDGVQTSDKVLNTLLRATDRLVIDSGEFPDPVSDLAEMNKLFTQENQRSQDRVGISDINWARLTLWRGLLADFYDVPAYQESLDEIDYVRIDYVAAETAPNTVAPQALLIAGWLASRLGWSLLDDQPSGENDEVLSFKFAGNDRGSSPTVKEDSTDRCSSPTVKEGSSDRAISLELNRVEHGEHIPGKLVRVELRESSDKPASFSVTRSADNVHLVAEAELGSKVHRGRVLPVRNRSAAQLLGREMEILCNDNIYQEAIALATTLADLSRIPPATNPQDPRPT